MTQLLLDGYRPVKNRWPVYLIDTEARQIETLWFSNQTEGGRAGSKCGFGDFRRVGGLRSRHDGFFALYAQGGALHLWLDGQAVNLDRHKVEVKRGTDFLLRKHFRVVVDGRKAFECRYSYLDYEDFPDEDIFWGMTRSLATPSDRLRKLLLLEDKAKGAIQSTDVYLMELNERVKRRMASTG